MAQAKSCAVLFSIYYLIYLCFALWTLGLRICPCLPTWEQFIYSVKQKGQGWEEREPAATPKLLSPPHQDEERAYAKAEDLNIDPLRTIHALFLWGSLHITLGYMDPSLRTADVKSIKKHTGTQNFKVQSTSALYRGVNWAREMSKKSLLNKLTHILFTQQNYFLLWCKWVFLGFYSMLCRKN